MNTVPYAVALAVVCASSAAFAQGSNPDFRIKADFRTPDNGLWGANQSVGNAEFRVQSRFLAVYYGGVARSDEFKFAVQIDFSTIPGFTTEFPGSAYNTNFDVYINDDFVGRAVMGLTTTGIAELQYDSRHPSPPALPIPAGWPSPIDPGSTVRVFTAGAQLPNIGDPVPAGTPVFTSPLLERFARGDANHDGRVDNADFGILAGRFDPFHLAGSHIGPANGDFTGDNLADGADYAMLVQNWTAGGTPPSVPSACIGAPTPPAPTSTCLGGSASFSVTAAGTAPFSYQWRRNGVAISNAANSTARSARLVITNAGAASAGNYDCAVTTACGSVVSAPAQLSVCVADVDDGTGSGRCDGGVTVDDLVYYLDQFDRGFARADVDNGTGIGVPDGGVTIDDLLYYLFRFDAGC